MNLKDKKILVTGADGFIGSHLTEELMRRGCHVRAFVHYNSFNSWGWLDHSDPEIVHSVEAWPGDIRDPHAVKEAIRGCDIVFHLAALIGIPFSYSSPDSYIDTNVKGTLNIVQAVRELGIDKVIHTSTSEVYGTARFVPITENHPLQGQSPYSASKIAADQLALSFFYSFDTPVSVIRPFNTYGPRQSARAIIPTIITQLAKGNRTLRLGALEPTRDFNYVMDVVRGFIAAAESEKSVGEIVNIGSQYEISIRDLVNVISKIMGIEVNLATDEERLRPDKSEVQRLLADNNKAKDLLGWRPCYSGEEGLIRGLTETIKWFTDSENLKGYKTGIFNK